MRRLLSSKRITYAAAAAAADLPPTATKHVTAWDLPEKLRLRGNLHQAATA